MTSLFVISAALATPTLVPGQGIKGLIADDTAVDALLGTPAMELAGPLAIELGEGELERPLGFLIAGHSFTFDHEDRLSELSVLLKELGGLETFDATIPADATKAQVMEALNCTPHGELGLCPGLVVSDVGDGPLLTFGVTPLDIQVRLFNQETGQVEQDLFFEDTSPMHAQLDQGPYGGELLVTAAVRGEGPLEVTLKVSQGQALAMVKGEAVVAAGSTWHLPAWVRVDLCAPVTVEAAVGGDAPFTLTRVLELACAE